MEHFWLAYIINVFNRLIYGATSQFEYLEKYGLNLSSLSFVIRVNLFHPSPSLFLYGLLLSL